MCGRLRSRQELAHPKEAVGSGDEGSGQGRSLNASEPRPPEAAYGLHPAKDFLDPFADHVADSVAAMACGAAVDRGRLLLRDVRDDVALATCGDEAPHVIALVAAQGDATVAELRVIEHLQRIAPFGPTVGLVDAEIHEQAVAILHQRVR